jgi:DNA-binding NtrC family response regulator
VPRGPLRLELAGYEQRLILEALEATGGNQSGLPRRTLSSKLAQYGIKKRYESDG